MVELVGFRDISKTQDLSIARLNGSSVTSALNIHICILIFHEVGILCVVVAKWSVYALVQVPPQKISLSHSLGSQVLDGHREIGILVF